MHYQRQIDSTGIMIMDSSREIVLTKLAFSEFPSSIATKAGDTEAIGDHATIVAALTASAGRNAM